MDNLKDLALYEYFAALSADEPAAEGIAVRLQDGNVLHASTLSIWNHQETHCLRLTADEALHNKLGAHYGAAIFDTTTQPVVFKRVRVKYNDDNPRDPHIELS